MTLCRDNTSPVVEVQSKPVEDWGSFLKIYINYPNPHITCHGSLDCVDIQKMDKPGQRHIEINRRTLSRELEKFAQKEYRFAAQAEFNDLWCTVDFADANFEIAVVEYIRRLLLEHYFPFSRAAIKTHC